MKSLAYLLVEAENPTELQEKCNDVMQKEELEGELMYVYEPLGAPFIQVNAYGFPVFFQAFQLQMLMPMMGDEMPQQRLDS